MPATLAASGALAALVLLPQATSWIRPWIYGLYLEAAGPPPPSSLAALVTLDAEEAALASMGLDAFVPDLTEAILRHRPAAVAWALPGGGEEASESLRGPQGPIVLGAAFERLARDDGEALAGEESLARSAYPHLEEAAGLRLPRGEGLSLPGELPWRSATGAFTGPLAAAGDAPSLSGRLYSLPAFARHGRGVVAGLGVEAVRRALGIPAASVNHVEGVGVLFDPAHILPVDGEGRMLLRFHPPSGIPALRASAVLRDEVGPGDLRGKVVIVAEADAAPVSTVAGWLQPGRLWATAASNLLEKGIVSAPSWGGILSVAMGLSFSAILLAVLFADAGGLITLLLGILLAALYPALSLWLFVKSSWWLPPELPAFMIAGSALPFALARMLSPRRRAAAPPIRPAPAYDPVVAMGGGPMRPAPGAPAAPRPPGSTPARGIPRTPASPAAAASAAPQPRTPSSRERQGPAAPDTPPRAPQAVPASAGAPPQPAPRPAQQAAAAPAAPAQPAMPVQAPQPAAPAADPPPAAEAFRDPPAVPGPAAPRPAVTPMMPVMPHPHGGTISDDIERDAKGGLVRVGKYRIVRKMGFGSGGDVFEGFDTHMGRKVAIKTITKEASSHFDRAAERFVVEAKAAGSLNHPCINTIYDFGSIRDVSYMVLEYLDGVTLSQWMRQHPVPSPRDVAHWVRQICSALDYAHSQRVIHRDLKPANLMVVNQGATIKLLDFGIAKLEDVGLTQTGMTVGTPSYMSPEQLTGSKVTAASDQYGLAVVIYQLFTYKLPYQGTKIPELCNRILKNELIPITEANPSLGAPFWEALKKALSKSPEDRYPDCAALCDALEAAHPAAPVAA
jgi:hypothetical protein